MSATHGQGQGQGQGDGAGEGEPVVWERWYSHDDGRVVRRTLHSVTGLDGGAVDVTVPAGFAEITADQARERIAAADRQATEAAAEAGRQAAAIAEHEYRTMIEAGFPETLARRLSGHRGASMIPRQHTGDGG